MDNSETRQRIMRALEARWRGGYAVGSIKPGYTRVPTTPATDREPARGPFRDQKNAKWTTVIWRAHEMIAAKDPPWVVAKYLAESGLPKSPRARLKEWTVENVIRFIRDPIYRGEELYKVRHNEKKFRLGKSVQVPTPPDQILRRQMPHLAHVPRWLWEASNRAIDERNTNKNAKNGKEHQLHGIPLDSRGAISQLFFCSICRAKMYRNPECYHCANSRSQPNLKRQGDQRCWNRCTPSTRTVHENLANAIVGALLAQEGCFGALCAEVVRLRVRQAEHEQVQAEIERLVAQNQVDVPLPTPDDMRLILRDVKAKLLGDFGREVGPLLRRLIDGKILAVPYKLFDRNSVHLLAHFTLNLLGLLPDQWPQLLGDRATQEEITELAETRSVPMVVDLFKRPPRVANAPTVYTMVQGGLTIRETARRLGLPETTANRAYRTGKAMTEQGLEDAYVMVESMPKRPGRWRPHSNRPDVFDVT